MKICKACDTEYRDDYNSCPMCGSNKYYSESELKEEEERSKKEIENYKRSVGKDSKLKYRIRLAATVLILLLLLSMSAYFIVQKVQFNREIQYLYESGQYSYENGDLEDAITTLSVIPKDSKYYKSAQEMITDASNRYIIEVEQKVNHCLTEKDYDTAMDIIDNARFVLPEESIIADLYEKVLAKYKNYTLAKIEKLVNKGNYGDAVKLLTKAYEKSGHDIEIKAKLNVCIGKYREDLFTRSDKAFKSIGYEAAIDILDEGRELLGEDKQIEEKASYYLKQKPVKLIDLTPFSGSLETETQPIKDYNGKEYTNGYLWDGEDSEASYLLESKYKRLKGTFVKVLEYRDYKYISDLKIYGDDKLLYSGSVGGTEKREDKINIDITNINVLKIEYNPGFYYSGEYTILANMILTK